MQEEESYWQREASWCDHWHEPVPAHADFVIVGGGISGLSTAIQLRGQNPTASIVLLEAERVGYGASGRNAGFLSPVAAPIWLLSAERNPEAAWAVWHINQRMHQSAAWLAAHLPECEITRARLSIQATSIFSDAGLRECSLALGAAGVAHQLATSRVQHGRLFLKMEAHSLHPYRLVRGLAQHATAAAIQICERQRVARIETTAPGALLTLDKGNTIRATQVVLCTNAYTAGLNLGERIRALSMHSFMAATIPLAPGALEDLARDADFTVELNAAHSYHRRHGERIVYGGRDSVFSPRGGDFAVPARVQSALQNDMRKSYPRLQASSFSEVWSGRLHATATGMPIIRRSSKHPALTLNLGYGGTGVALALVFAPMVAAIAAGRSFVTSDDQRLARMLEETRLPIRESLRALGSVMNTLARPWLPR